MEEVMEPNIFDIATKELSQDAFIAWLLQWGDKSNEKYDKSLHSCGVEFAKRLIKKQIEGFNEDIKKVNSGRQWLNIDIWAEINDEYFIIIEDKTNTKQHSNQLVRYKEEATKWCEENSYKLVCIYLKTGNESQQSLKEVEKEGYAVYNRNDFLNLLREYQIKNDVYNDYLKHLEGIERRNNEWEEKAIKNWDGNDWQGFFQFVESKIDICGWDYVNNPNGGFWNAVLNWDYYDIYPLYIQTEEYKLCFKISTDPEELEMPEGVTRSMIRNEISDFILKEAETKGYKEIMRPYPFGSGKYMTVAVVEGKDWFGDIEEKINKEKVITNLTKYLSFLQLILTDE
jgi:hypothetical protein